MPVDPVTATVSYYAVSAICWPVVKLGGIGAGVIGPWLGFGTAGVVKGSLAAAAQAAFPSVAAGTVFSGMQSAAATAAAAGTGLVGAVGVVPAVAVGAVTYGVYKIGAVGMMGGYIASKLI